MLTHYGPVLTFYTPYKKGITGSKGLTLHALFRRDLTAESLFGALPQLTLTSANLT